MRLMKPIGIAAWYLACTLIALVMMAPPAAATPPRIVQVEVGYFHSCALDDTGRVWCWGRNADGQLGDGTTTDRLTPVPVASLEGVAGIATGYYHSCAWFGDGSAQCWGRNAEGQLGDGSTTDRTSPVPVSGLGDVAEIALGSNFSCARLTSGEVRCWGYNFGQLGNGTNTRRLTPAPVTGLSGVVGISALASHSCAVTTDGEARCWGSNFNGQLGDGTTTNRWTPTAVTDLSGVAGIAAGFRHSCAWLTNGEARCWGHNEDGQLNDGTTTNRLTPVPMSGLTTVSEIALDFNTSLVLLANGEVRRTPSLNVVPELSAITGLSAHYYHSCYLQGNGEVRCHGSNSWGQLGNGTTTFPTTPVRVAFTPSPTATSLTGPETSPAESWVILTATVTSPGGTPHGSVSFRRNGVEFATRNLNANGVASAGVQNLLPGEHGGFTAHFTGNPAFAASSSDPVSVTITPLDVHFIGGGVVFGQTAQCGPVLGSAPQGVTVSYSPAELNGLPSGVSISWPEGSEHLALWGTMASGGDFFGGAGRGTWTRFVFYPTRPLIRVVSRTVTEPRSCQLRGAHELVLRLRVQNFAATPGCSVTLAATLRRDPFEGLGPCDVL